MPQQERYLVSVNLHSVPTLKPEVLVIGSGVAGLAAALAAAESAQVLLLTKDALPESNTYYAQGGVAVALGADDSPEQHLADTLKAGAGLCDEDAVRVLVNEGVARCREIIGWGLPPDREGGEIALGIEGAHSRRRILHAAGDSIGKAIIETLLQRTHDHPQIARLENHFVIDLLHQEETCFGALAIDSTYGRHLGIEAGATIVASGGLGQLFRETTNPAGATGDGYALCFRAGAVLRDMEFVQFHPTTLYLAGAPRFLISEAVRGEGARLLSLNGERFMPKYAPEAELAPRDVVSRSIAKEMDATGASHVLLDLRHLEAGLIRRRFPTIQAICADYGLNLVKDMIPVRPAVHYMMGGVKVDLDGLSTIDRLYVTGEAAATGVHGANRLASNSLLEGLVFGRRAGVAAATARERGSGRGFSLSRIARLLEPRTVPLDVDDIVRSLKAQTWRDLGIFRDQEGLAEAERMIAFWRQYVLAEQFQARRGFEVQNMVTVALVMARAASLRQESRGAHQRRDFPEPDPAWQRHIELSLGDFEG